MQLKAKVVRPTGTYFSSDNWIFTVYQVSSAVYFVPIFPFFFFVIIISGAFLSTFLF